MHILYIILERFVLDEFCIHSDISPFKYRNNIVLTLQFATRFLNVIFFYSSFFMRDNCVKLNYIDRWYQYRWTRYARSLPLKSNTCYISSKKLNEANFHWQVDILLLFMFNRTLKQFNKCFKANFTTQGNNWTYLNIVIRITINK